MMMMIIIIAHDIIDINTNYYHYHYIYISLSSLLLLSLSLYVYMCMCVIIYICTNNRKACVYSHQAGYWTLVDFSWDDPPKVLTENLVGSGEKNLVSCIESSY